MKRHTDRFAGHITAVALVMAGLGCSGGPAFEIGADASEPDAGGKQSFPGGGSTGVGGARSGGGAAGFGGTNAAGSAGVSSGGQPGCGIAQEGAQDAAECRAIKAALLHRYSFNGTGTVANDSVSGAHGTIVNTTLSNSGALVLAGAVSDQYVNLPNGIVSGLTDATFEVWLTWTDGDIWQRVFDFGTSGAEDKQERGTSYFFLSPRSGLTAPGMRVAFAVAGRESETVVDSPVLAAGVLSHLTVVVSDTADTLALYVDGVPVASTAFTAHLSELTDINNWIGRSQFATDAELSATLAEFRVYRAALTAKQVALTHATGADPSFLRQGGP